MVRVYILLKRLGLFCGTVACVGVLLEVMNSNPEELTITNKLIDFAMGLLWTLNVPKLTLTL